MATYNGERFLEQQIASILGQTMVCDELIISDDGSKDATCSIINSFNDPRILLLHNPGPGSPVRNFGHALQHARGDFIFLADQDDLWEPDKIAVQSTLLHQYDLVISDCRTIDDSGRLLAESFFALRKSGAGYLKNLYKNTFLGCCMALRKSLLSHALPFPDGIAMHDIWLGLIAELYGTTFFCPEKLVRYRRHNATATKTAGKSTFTLLEQLSYRYRLLNTSLRRKVSSR